MANRWIDGVCVYGTAAEMSTSGKYQAVQVANAPNTHTDGRWGAQAIALVNGNSIRLVPTGAVLASGFFGMYVYVSSTPAASSLIGFLDSANSAQVTLTPTAAGGLEVRRAAFNGTLLGASASSGLLVVGRGQYVEFGSTISDTVGTYDGRVDGVSYVSGSGADTKNTANAGMTGVSIAPAFSVLLNDLYLNDDTGSAPDNTFWGDTRVDPKLPGGAGYRTQWTPSTGSNWSNVDDGTSPNTTDYNESSTVGNGDSFTLTPALATPTAVIRTVAITVWALKTDANARTLRAVVRSGTTNGNGAAFALSSTYAGNTTLFPTNPATGAAWTATEVDAMEAGYEVVS